MYNEYEQWHDKNTRRDISRPRISVPSETSTQREAAAYPGEELVSTELIRPYPQVDVGLFFGAYDPPHWGHGRTAQHVRNVTGMKEVWFVPSAYHRFGKNMSPIQERVKMLRALRDQIGELPDFRVAPLESHFGVSDGKAYRVLQALGVQPQEAGTPISKSRYAIILGLDNYSRFHEWWHAQDILRSVPVFFASRPGNIVPDYIHQNMHILPDFIGNSADYTSTSIRNSYLNGLQDLPEITSLLPADIRVHIHQQGLYQQKRTEQETR